VIGRAPWWRTIFAMSSVDTVSAAIYGGVLLAHLPPVTGVEIGWGTSLSIAIVVLLFVIDRAESISNILGRLGLRDRTQAAMYARDHGLS
jgi:hypothetical protein